MAYITEVTWKINHIKICRHSSIIESRYAPVRYASNVLTVNTFTSESHYKYIALHDQYYKVEISPKIVSCNSSYLLWEITPFSKSEYHLLSWSIHSERRLICLLGDNATDMCEDGCVPSCCFSFERFTPLPKYGNAGGTSVDTCFPICIIWAQAFSCSTEYLEPRFSVRTSTTASTSLIFWAQVCFLVVGARGSSSSKVRDRFLGRFFSVLASDLQCGDGVLRVHHFHTEVNHRSSGRNCHTGSSATFRCALQRKGTYH